MRDRPPIKIVKIENTRANDSLYHISLTDMGRLLHLKKLHRKQKESDFNCFVINSKSLENFLKKLKANLSGMLNPTRFQLAVYDIKNRQNRPNRHWNLIDLYIKDSILHSFVLDAAGIKEVINNEYACLKEYFPTGKHYGLSLPNHLRKVTIQASTVDCQTFTLEHASLISKMDPNKLYTHLDIKSISNPKMHNVKEMDLDILNNDHESSFMTPLIRCMQSLSNFKKISPEITNSAIVSKNKNLTLHDYFTRNLDGKINRGILIKEKKYASQLKSAPHESNYDHSGFGYITFPVLARLSSTLENYTCVEFHSLLKNLIHDINSYPKYTDKLSFLKVPAIHFKQSQETVKHLQDLENEIFQNNFTKETVIKFTDLIYKYVGYLDEYKSQRTLSRITQFFDSLETKQGYTYSIMGNK